MNRRNPFLLASLGLLLAAKAEALTSDHLQCYKVKDAAAKASYVATLTPTDPAFVAANGCSIKVPAKLICVDTTKSAVSPAPPGAPDGPPAQTYLCYKTKCPASTATKTVSDQFGSHALTVGKTGLLCAPVDTVLATTTTTLDPGCLTAGDCPGMDTDCQTRTCTASVCGFSFAPNGTTVMSQTAGDCMRNVCDGAGGVVPVVDDTDVPADDGNQCTSQACSMGSPIFPNAPQGIPCAQGGGVVCSAGGACVQCNSAGDCPASPTVCQTPVCSSNFCGTINVADDTPCSEGGGTACVSGVCTNLCGNGIIQGAEGCDDNNLVDNDGCSSSCSVESGYMCSGSPSTCTATCGDGIIAGAEGCDDANVVDSDGCSSSCSVESGYMCTGSPSVCAPL